ncbi:unnamed protein product [Clonostachys rosea]|uniref:Major facilitator superfamily (MFS) profile domain-containing protein n=1 Tax=Bionectria ochroleuca TaxID=29856 RepID=A0ABY6UEZ9_BIOOC|nr:unnamed protein product [Clonostachys rosea]
MDPVSEAAEIDTHAGGQQRSFLTDLPTDILVYLRDNFLHLGELGKDKLEWDEPWGAHAANESFKTVQNLRQVCRIFHDLVSPLLCRRLRIHLDPKSLDQAREMLKNQAIASGVRGVQVAIPYRPEELALSLSSFVDVRLKELEELYDHILFMLDVEWMEDDADENGEDSMHEESYTREMKNYNDILFTWRPSEASKNQNGDDAEAENKFVYEIEPAVREEYTQILLQGHKIFREQHEAQKKLIEKGLFVETVADLFREMPNSVSLSIVDRFTFKHDQRREISLLTNKEELSPFLTSPINWSELDTMSDPPRLVPARILTELPIAIHKSGRSLRHLHLGCLPVQHGFEELDPGTDDFSWAQLREAYQQLEEFDLEGPQMHYLPLRPENIPLPRRQFLIEFFGAILSSNKLQDVQLNFYCLGVNTGINSRRQWCPLGAIFRSISWPDIRKIQISDVGFSQDELDMFFKGLGFGLERVALTSFQLSSGSWADAVDMMHDRIAPQPTALEMFFHFADITGASETFDLQLVPIIFHKYQVKTSSMAMQSATQLRDLSPAAVREQDSSNPMHDAFEASQDESLATRARESNRQKALVILGTAISQLPIWGFAMSYGVFQEYFSGNWTLQGSRDVTGIIGTTSNGVMYLSMPFLFALFTKHWAHWRQTAAFAGAVLAGLGFLLSSFSTHVWHLVATQGVIAALGCALMYSPMTLSLGEWFTTGNRALAYGVALSCKNISGSACPFLFRFLLEKYGLGTTMRIWTAIAAVSGAIAIFLVPAHPSSLTPTETHRARRMPLHFLKHRTIYVYAIAIALQSSGYGISQTYLNTYAHDVTMLSQNSATLLLTLYNIPGILASSFFGYLADTNKRFVLSTTTVTAISAFGSALSALLFWGLTSKGNMALLAVFSITFGFFAGGYSATWGGIITDFEREAANGNEAIDSGLMYGLLNGARGVGYVSGGLASVSLLKAGTGMAFSSSGHFGLESTYGPLIIFTGLSSAFGGWAVFWK